MFPPYFWDYITFRTRLHYFFRILRIFTEIGTVLDLVLPIRPVFGHVPSWM